MFGWEEVYMSFSEDGFEEVVKWLDEKNIGYKYNIYNRGRGMVRSMTGRDPKKYTTQFCVFVRKEAFEEVRFLLGKAGIAD